MWQTCYPSLPENWELWVIHDDLHVKICRHLCLEAAEFGTFSEILLITVPKCLLLLAEKLSFFSFISYYVISKTGAPLLRTLCCFLHVP